MYLSDSAIKHRMERGDLKIMPFHPTKKGSPSYGLSSAGYDLRMGDEYVGIKYAPDPIHDCKLGEEDVIRGKIPEETGLLLNPGDCVLLHSLEYIRMPDDLVGFVLDKSTLARLFVDVKNTVIEPGWEGQITLEVSSRCTRPVALPSRCGIAQLMFSRIEGTVRKPYGDGKYQGQQNVTLPM